MNQILNIEEKYTSHEALKEWEKEKDQNNLTQNIVALLGIHGMHCKFYEYQNASHITKAFEDLFHQQLQKAREQSGKRNAVVKEYKDEGVMFILKVEDGKTYEASMPIPKWGEVGKVQLRDHSELDQDKK